MKRLTVALLLVLAFLFIPFQNVHAAESIHIDSAEWLSSTTIRFHYSNNTYAPGFINLDFVESDGSFHAGAKYYPESQTSGYADFTANDINDLYFGADTGYTRYYAFENGGGFANRSNIIRLPEYVTPSHTAPVTTINYSASPDNEGKYPNPTTITLSATADNGYQISQTYFTVDGGSTNTYSSPFPLAGTGSHTITYWSVDNSGLEETPHKSATVILQYQGIHIDNAQWLNSSTIRFNYSNNSYAPGGITLVFVEPDGSYHAGAKDYATSATSGYIDFSAQDINDLYFEADPGYTRYYALTGDGGVFSDRSNIVRLPAYSDAAPSINALLGGTINEASAYSENSSFADTDSNSWTATVDYGDDSGSQQLMLYGKNFNLSHVYKDNGTYTVTVSVTDNGGQIATQTATVTINNVTPSVGTISASVNPIQINTNTTASANFTDLGVLDTHTAVWNWGDGTTSNGTIAETNGSGIVSDGHTYTAPGIYTITLTVTDKDSGQGTSIYQYISAYDSTIKSITGTKEFTSPAGALIANPSVTGTANFGFTAQYDNNGNVIPIGTNWASVTFKSGNTTYVDFNAIAYTSLVISGAKVTLQGTGTYNGNSGYTVLITALEGTQSGRQDMIRYQIKNASGTVVYDTQPGAALTTDPTTPVSKGKITIK